MKRASWAEASVDAMRAYLSVPVGHRLDERARPEVERRLAAVGWTFDEWRLYRSTEAEQAERHRIFENEVLVASVIGS